MNLHHLFYTLAVIASLGVILVLLSGCSVNGRPMRSGAAATGEALPAPATSCYIEGKTPNGSTFSCSFVEFDERGDFLEFTQHKDCQRVISNLVEHSSRLLLVMYCHGWRNNSQS